MPETIRRPALRYHGGKFRLAPKILAQLPPSSSYTTYVEPFAGGLGVLLRKEPSMLEYVNDLDGEVVNFWEVLRDRRREFLQAIRSTPYSRAAYEQAFEVAADPLERARRLYIRSWQGRGGCRATWRTGWRTQKQNSRNKTVWSDWTDLRHLAGISRRLRRVGLENDNALALLRRYDSLTTLHYVDPPYLAETRSRWGGKAYACDFGAPEQHQRLAEVLHGLKGMVALSGRPTELYAELFEGWQRRDFQMLQDSGGSAVDSLWLNPALLRRRAATDRQIMIPGTRPAELVEPARIRVGSACSGAGLLDHAFELAGYKIAWQIEIDAKAQSALRRHWPTVPKHEDLRHVRAADLSPVDLLIGGTPCKDFSGAGRGAGLDGEHGRLFVDFIRLADELGVAWLVWENVPKVLYMLHGAVWSVLLEGFVGGRPAVPTGGWSNTGAAFGPLGWCVWRVLDSQYFGLAQRRKRLVVVRGPGDQPGPEVLLEFEGLSRDPSPFEKTRAARAAAAPIRFVASSPQVAHCLTTRPGQRFDASDTYVSEPAFNCQQDPVSARVAPALRTQPDVAVMDLKTMPSNRTRAHHHHAPTMTATGRLATRHGEPRRLTPLECERLQGLPDGFTEFGADGSLSDYARYRLIGEGVAVPVFHWLALRLRRHLLPGAPSQQTSLRI